MNHAVSWKLMKPHMQVMHHLGMYFLYSYLASFFKVIGSSFTDCGGGAMPACCIASTVVQSLIRWLFLCYALIHITQCTMLLDQYHSLELVQVLQVPINELFRIVLAVL